MKLNNIRSAYFIGIGGIGMSAIARYFMQKNINVAGYDKTKTNLTETLIAEGADIHFEDDYNKISKTILNDILSDKGIVVYTPAVPAKHGELVKLKNQGAEILKRAEVLGLITEQKFTIAVAGTHGKTTISSLLSHVLTSCKVNTTAFVGGILHDFNSNFISLPSEGEEVVVVEADEYDKSFLRLNPSVIIISSVDPDHLDIYGDVGHMHDTYRSFISKLKAGGNLILENKVRSTLSLSTNSTSYSFADKSADYYAIEKSGKYEITSKSGSSHINPGLPGQHNVENAIAVYVAAKSLKLDDKQICDAINSFKGVHRRFDIAYQDNNCTYIDDYAHHPTELRSAIAAAKKLYPGCSITGIFQPHLFSRTRDFALEFAKELDQLDDCILLPIYPAREKPIPHIDSRTILELMNNKNAKSLSKEDALSYISSNKTDVLLTLGAGDIDNMIEPIKYILSRRAKDGGKS